MKKQKRFYFLPKTKTGKVSLWLGISGLIVIILLNILAENAYCGLCPEGFRKDGNSCNPECYYSTPKCLSPSVEPFCNMGENDSWRPFDIVFGLLAMVSVLVSGILSFISIIKYKERAILIFIPVILGVLGLIFVLGEIFIPH